ncbi:divalent-cation tolerance protein CutA [Chitinispirillales bacterium ANBcel5]|uniref:divalent-cation tolerance protein CutA n=1 Tax=Cellulosispirillum alkaliphilum TaxID=3039283 RepID=UPI002A4F4B46|nr:divalent-cation tolerance protein CutA [Chitinispirillales bacterium ANBcel5]
MDHIFVYITAQDKQEAKEIASTLINERLAACANIIDGMSSVYRWEDKIVEDSEVILIAKTRNELFNDVAQRVRQLHSYSTPCIVALPLVEGSSDFLNWISEETKQD